MAAPSQSPPDTPTPSIGVVGGGQLAWMLAAAARDLAVPLYVQTPSADDPATVLASGVVQAPLNDLAATRRLAAASRAITFENEWVDLEGLAQLAAEGVTFLPSLRALAPLISKRDQRLLLQRLGLPSPHWMDLMALARGPAEPSDQAQASPAQTQASPAADPVAWQSGQAALQTDPSAIPPLHLPEGWSFPLMAKVATGGYDGKGTRLIREQDDLHHLWQEVDPSTWILEAFVPFELELSQLACRDHNGQVLCYPLVQTHQHQQVCDWVLTPAAVPHAVQASARNIAASLLTALDYVGVLSIELFYGPGGLLVNEIAPRTHNSGHVTIEACHTSQFAQQARIVAGLPMGPVDLQVPGALMVNLLGFEDSSGDYGDRRERLAALPGAQVHWYGKRLASPGRKLGHVTLLLEASSPAERERQARDRLESVRAIWPLAEAAHRSQ